MSNIVSSNTSAYEKSLNAGENMRAEKMKAVLEPIGAEILKESLKPAIISVSKTIGEKLGITGLQEFAKDVGEQGLAKTVGQRVVGAITTKAKAAVDEATNAAQSAVEDATSQATNAVEDATSQVSNAVSSIRQTVSTAQEAIGDEGGDFGDVSATSNLRQLFTGFDDGSSNEFSDSLNSIMDETPAPRDMSSFNDTVDEASDVVEAETGESSSAVARAAAAVAARDGELANFKPSIPRPLSRAFNQAKSAESDAQDAFDNATKAGVSDDAGREAFENLRQANNAVSDAQGNIESEVGKQTAKLKTTLNNKYNLDEKDNLIEDEPAESLEPESLASVPSRISGLAGAEEDVAPGYRVLADAIRQRATTTQPTESGEQVRDQRNPKAENPRVKRQA